jgi:hypothetical protein
MSKKYSYSLNQELMEMLESEFPLTKLVNSYKEALDRADEADQNEIDEMVFGTFGRMLADRICEVEGQYRDRGAEVIYMIAEKTGHTFPSIQQRLLEIALLAVMNENKIGFHEVSFKRLAYEVKRCVMNQALERALGKETSDKVPCRHLCLQFYERICENTGLGDMVNVHMPSKISDENGRCIFSAELTLEERLRLSTV